MMTLYKATHIPVTYTSLILLQLSLFEQCDERACFMVLHHVLMHCFLHLALSLFCHTHCQECPKYRMNPLSLQEHKQASEFFNC